MALSKCYEQPCLPLAICCASDPYAESHDFLSFPVSQWILKKLNACVDDEPAGPMWVLYWTLIQWFVMELLCSCGLVTWSSWDDGEDSERKRTVQCRPSACQAADGGRLTPRPGSTVCGSHIKGNTVQKHCLKSCISHLLQLIMWGNDQDIWDFRFCSS